MWAHNELSFPYWFSGNYAKRNNIGSGIAETKQGQQYKAVFGWGSLIRKAEFQEISASTLNGRSEERANERSGRVGRLQTDSAGRPAGRPA